MCGAFGSCTRCPRGKGPGEGPEWWHRIRFFRYLGVALPPSISGAAWGRGRRSQQPRFGGFIPIGNFLVKTRGCGGCSQWEGGVERNLGLVASTWSQACTLAAINTRHAIDMLCLYPLLAWKPGSGTARPSGRPSSGRPASPTWPALGATGLPKPCHWGFLGW
jgi:hypothetical protein